jgi:hypothetical protein
MKHTFILLTSLLLFTAGACKAQQKNNSEPVATTEPTVYKGVTDKACAVEISFGSSGGGIDGKVLDEVTKLIESKKLKSTSKSVGREGETRICLPLTELKGKEKTKFIAQLKKIVKGGQLTSVSIR